MSDSSERKMWKNMGSSNDHLLLFAYCMLELFPISPMPTVHASANVRPHSKLHLGKHHGFLRVQIPRDTVPLNNSAHGLASCM